MNNSIACLGADICAEHAAVQSAMQTAVTHAIRAGELLIQAKDEIQHGEFGNWCKSLPFSESTTRGYMRLARLDPEKRQRVADLPLRQALESIAAPTLDDDVLALARAKDFEIRCDAEYRDIRLRLTTLQRTLDDPSASFEELAYIVRDSEKLLMQATGLQVEAKRGLGHCLIELKRLTELNDADLLPILTDGSLIRAANERIAQLEAAS